MSPFKQGAQHTALGSGWRMRAHSLRRSRCRDPAGARALTHTWPSTHTSASRWHLRMCSGRVAPCWPSTELQPQSLTLAP